MEIKTILKNQIIKLDEILSLSNADLLKSERMHETIISVEDTLKEISSQLDERSQLSIERIIPMWRNIPKIGVFVSEETVIKKVTPLKALILEILSTQFSEPKSGLSSEIVINAGQPYDGRLYLRQIINEAVTTLFIRDSYFRPEILDVLSEYLLDKFELKIQILMGDNERLPAFRASYKVFEKQFPGRLEAKFSSKKDHPRYIVVDDQLIFNPDHSLDQWGEKTVNIHQMSDKTQIEKVKNNLSLEWGTAIKI